MATMHLSDGRVIETRAHYATFRGKHNCNVVKLLLTLDAEDKPLSLKQLHKYSGIPYHSLKARLHFWSLIRYVSRAEVDPPAGEKYFVYTIGDRGLKVLRERIPDDIRDKYVYEISVWRRSGK